jgi:hypothetical protein
MRLQKENSQLLTCNSFGDFSCTEAEAALFWLSSVYRKSTTYERVRGMSRARKVDEVSGETRIASRGASRQSC